MSTGSLAHAGRARPFVLVLLVLATRPAAAQDVEVPPPPTDEASTFDAESAAELEAAEAATGTAAELGAPVTPPGYAPRVVAQAADEARATRLEALLEAHARASRAARLEGGVVSLVAGGIIVATGATLLALDDASDPLFFILGGLSMALGLGTATTGLIGVVHSAAPERRYEAFQRDRSRGTLDARRLGRYEGALWADAEGASDARILGIAGAVLLAANGIVQVVFTAQFAPDDTFRALGYGLGGVYAALGVLELVLAFQESDAERRFREYEATFASLAVRPWAGATGVGLTAAGTF